jgi:NAD(P)H-nitrite reductase large subunit
MPEGTIKIGQTINTTNMEGNVNGKAKIIAIKQSQWQNKRSLLSLEVPIKNAENVASIQIQPAPHIHKPHKIKQTDDDEIVICRCERVTKKEIKDYIKKTGTRDVNAVKAALRVGMGPCGGKTCTDHITRIYRELGINPKEIEPHVIRPFTQEVPMKSFLQEKKKK